MSEVNNDSECHVVFHALFDITPEYLCSAYVEEHQHATNHAESGVIDNSYERFWLPDQDSMIGKSFDCAFNFLCENVYRPRNLSEDKYFRKY